VKLIKTLLGTLCVSGFLAACGGGSDSTPAGATSPPATLNTTNLDEALKTSGSTSTMAGAATSADLSSTLAGKAAYTLLMPEDAAMSPFAEDLAELKLPENREALADYVKAHMVDGKVLQEQLQSAGVAAAAAAALPTDAAASEKSIQTKDVSIEVTNVLGQTLTVEVDDKGVLTINGAQITQANIAAGSGVLHIFNAPIFRPNVFSIIKNLPQTSTLEAAIIAADLKKTLKDHKSTFTVLAPTNEAFDQLLKDLNLTAAQLLANKPLLTQVLTYHVIAGRAITARQFKDGETIMTVNGQRLIIKSFRDKGVRKIEITDATGKVSKVTLANLHSRNGIVHLIDRVLLPTSKDIVGIAAGNPDFSILVEAVTAAGLVDTLKSAGPFTVFAPTNQAFANLLAELKITKAALLADKPLLTAVLTYHVLGSKVFAGDLKNSLAVGTVEGQPIKFDLNGKTAIVDANGRVANIVATNIQATNGVVHVIDKVILPTSKNIVQVAQGNPDFSILVEAVVAADLAATLSGKGPFTVFAPTNQAFANLLTELNLTKAALLANKPLLTKVLTYHVLASQVLSSQIPFGKPVATVEGDTLTIGNDLKITDQAGRKSNIVATDVAATNGVVHVIDKVILPKL
jgi:transforming growth factor-beta-induced protein